MTIFRDDAGNRVELVKNDDNEISFTIHLSDNTSLSGSSDNLETAGMASFEELDPSGNDNAMDVFDIAEGDYNGWIAIPLEVVEPNYIGLNLSKGEVLVFEGMLTEV